MYSKNDAVVAYDDEKAVRAYEAVSAHDDELAALAYEADIEELAQLALNDAVAYPDWIE